MSHRRITATRPARPAIALVGGLVAVTALVGCGSASENIAERVIEQVSGSSIDIEIDAESGEFSIQTEDGDGSFAVGGDVPAAWNDLLGVMPGATVAFTSSMSSDQGQIDSVTLDVAGDIDSVLDYYGPKLLAAGFSETGRYSNASGGDSAGGATFERGKETVSISATSSGGTTSAVVGLVVEP